MKGNHSRYEVNGSNCLLTVPGLDPGIRVDVMSSESNYGREWQTGVGPQTECCSLINNFVRYFSFLKRLMNISEHILSSMNLMSI